MTKEERHDLTIFKVLVKLLMKKNAVIEITWSKGDKI